MSALEVITFGCRLNRFETEVARSQALAAGLGDTVIVNTCAVTAEAERQARQAIRRARRKRPEARIIVTGCAAQLRPEAFAAMPEVDAVLGNAEKLDAACYGALAGKSVQVADIMAVHETASHLISGLEGRSRAFVQIQQGCDHRCTFCVIPYARGPSRSVAPEHAIKQARRLVANGYAELVLTGVDITAYGEDLPERPTLGALARRLLAEVPELKRLRLSSLDVAEVDSELMAAIAEEERLMPHLHLSLQAGDDLVLKRMKRRHSRAQAIEFCEAVRRLRPDVTFGADLIAGFPTESAAMFGRTVELVADCGLTYLHVFPYSSREGTPAARMPQVPVPERKVRAAALRAAGSEALDGFLHSRTGSTESVLAEDSRRGRTEQFAPIELDAEVSPGSVVSARVTGVAAGALSATPLPSARR